MSTHKKYFFAEFATVTPFKLTNIHLRLFWQILEDIEDNLSDAIPVKNLEQNLLRLSQIKQDIDRVCGYKRLPQHDHVRSYVIIHVIRIIADSSYMII